MLDQQERVVEGVVEGGSEVLSVGCTPLRRPRDSTSLT